MNFTRISMLTSRNNCFFEKKLFITLEYNNITGISQRVYHRQTDSHTVGVTTYHLLTFSLISWVQEQDAANMNPFNNEF